MRLNVFRAQMAQRPNVTALRCLRPDVSRSNVCAQMSCTGKRRLPLKDNTNIFILDLCVNTLSQLWSNLPHVNYVTLFVWY